MKTFFLTSWLLIVMSIAKSQNSADPGRKSLNDSCDRFMKLFQSGKELDAVRMLKTISLMDETTVDKLVEQVEGQLETIDNNYGKALSYQLIKERDIKGTVIKRYYLLYLEKFYLKFTFTLYKSSLGWKLTHFVYDEDIEDLF